MNKDNDLTLIIITLNEEQRIERCIKSVPFAKHVIVVDSGSTDKTCEIAKSLGAELVFNKWEGYGNQKNFATQLSKTNWVLSLDADEWLSEELAEEIKVTISQNTAKAYTMKRLSRYLGKDIYHGGWYPDWQLRLYKKDSANWDKNEKIHETVKTKDKVEKLFGKIYHEPFRTIEEQLETNSKYAKLLAERKFEQGRRISCPSFIILKTIFRFIENYFIKLGILDGLSGFIIAWNSAQSYMMQLTQIYLLGKKETK